MDELDKTVVEEEQPAGPSLVARLMGVFKKYGVYAAIVVAMTVAAYLVTVKVVQPMMAGKPAATAPGGETATTEPHDSVAEEPDSEAVSEGEKGGEEGEDKGEGENASHQSGNVYMIDGIIVNPAETGGTRYLSTSVGFALSSKVAGGRFTEREAVVRDALITILSSQSIAELTDFRQRERLRKVIKQRVEKLLKAGDVAAVYFTEFVLQ